jgi:hypothetical protein
MMRRLYGAFITCLLLLSASGALASSSLTKREHLTPQEIDRVKEAQILDKRIEVYVKAAERRLLALSDPNAASSKQTQKDMEKWGELPKGTRADLLSDISHILEEAITNIDDVASRDEKNHLLPKALRKLADAAARFAPQLSAMRTQARDSSERDAFNEALEKMEEIIAAAQKLPPPEQKEKKQ